MNWKEWQTVADDEARWIDHGARGLLKAEHLRDFILRLWFEEVMDVSIYDLDFQPLAVDSNPGGVFSPLAEQNYFRLATGNYALIWPNPQTGVFDDNVIDLAPECVRFFSERYGKLVKPAVNSQPEPVAA